MLGSSNYDVNIIICYQHVCGLFGTSIPLFGTRAFSALGLLYGKHVYIDRHVTLTLNGKLIE